MDPRQWLHPALRIMLLLTSVLVLVMPITESIWNFDRFLRGGTDVEFTLLAGLLFSALVLLSMERSMTQSAAAVVFRALARIAEDVRGLLDEAPPQQETLLSHHLLTPKGKSPVSGGKGFAPLRI